MKRYIVISNDSHATRKKVYETDDLYDAMNQCDINAYHNSTHTYTVLDMQPVDYKYDVYYAEYTFNLYYSYDNETWEKIPHDDLKYHF